MAGEVLHFDRLLGPESAAYEAMTYAGWRELLRGLRVDSPALAIGVRNGREPCGLGLAVRDGDELEIVSLAMAPAWQRRGAGTHLLRLMEELAGSSDLRGLRLAYSTELAAAGAVERILDKLGWGVPEPEMLLAQISPAMAARTRWIAELKVPAQFEVFPWSDLSDTERQELEEIRASVPGALWPLAKEEAPLEPANAIGLRRDGSVAAWWDPLESTCRHASLSIL